MNTQRHAQIYLADQRGFTETGSLRSYQTFRFGGYQPDGREPFGPLCLLNDDTLRVGASQTMRVETATVVGLMPLVGGLEYTAGGPPAFLEPGQAQTLRLPGGTTYTVSNPYETKTINFLQFWLTDAPGTISLGVGQTAFDLNQKNALLPLFELRESEANDADIRGFIGRYDGRRDDTYTVRNGEFNGIFVFVLTGVFEVANRLLHERDGLAIRYGQADVLEFESLSNDAILILIEIPMKG